MHIYYRTADSVDDTDHLIIKCQRTRHKNITTTIQIYATNVQKVIGNKGEGEKNMSQNVFSFFILRAQTCKPTNANTHKTLSTLKYYVHKKVDFYFMLVL